MTYLSNLLYTIVFIVILTPVAMVIFKFFGLTFIDYGNYLLWFIALALFSAILPIGQNSIFKEVSDTITDVAAEAKNVVGPSVVGGQNGGIKVSKHKKLKKI